MKIVASKADKPKKTVTVKASKDSVLKKVVKRVTRKTTKKPVPFQEIQATPVVEDKPVAQPSKIIDDCCRVCVCRVAPRNFGLV